MGRIPEVAVRIEQDGDAVRVLVTGGGRSSMTAAREIGPDLADAEASSTFPFTPSRRHH